MEDEEGAEDAEVRSIITSPDGPRPQQLRSGRDFWQLYEKGETLGRGHFAKVKLVRERSSGAFFAAKIVIKQHDDDLATWSQGRILKGVLHWPGGSPQKGRSALAI